MKKVVAIDLGGTSIKGGLVNNEGKIFKKISKDTGSDEGRNIVLKRIVQVIKELIEGEKIEGIGLGSPGFIDIEEGRVLSVGGNIADWAGVYIKEELSKEFGKYPIFIENDANVAAICEEWQGAAKGLNSFIMLTLGTGVGGAIYSKESGIWHGNKYQGSELGHSILYPNGKECTCGQRGCLEQYISGNAIEQRYYDLIGERLEGKDILENSQTQENCKKVVEGFAMDLGIFLASIKNIIDPQGVIIGGGVINSKEYWWDKAIQYYFKSCNNPEGMRILPAKYLNDSGIIGAAKLVFDRI